MPQGDGTGPQGQGPRSGKDPGRCNSKGRNPSQQGQGGKRADRRQGQGAGKGAGRGQGRGRGTGQGRGGQT